MKKRVYLMPEDMNGMEILGRRIRLARLRRNLTQAEMAERCGVTRKTYAALEAGDSGVSLGCLSKTLAVLGYSDRVKSLMNDDPIGFDIESEKGRQRARGGDHDVVGF